MTEWDYTLNAYYGTGLSLVARVERSEDVVLQVLSRMAIRLKRSVVDVRTVMLLTSDPSTLEARLRQRGYRGSALDLRIEHGKEEVTHSPLFDFLVPDADILPEEDVLRTLREIVSSRHL